MIGDLIIYVQNLSPNEIKIVIGAIALLILFLVYKRIGKGAALALIIVYSIAYILYVNNLFGYYKTHENENDKRMKAIEAELIK